MLCGWVGVWVDVWVRGIERWVWCLFSGLSPFSLGALRTGLFGVKGRLRDRHIQSPRRRAATVS